MPVRFRKYIPEQDFLRVCDFLVNTYQSFEKPVNWRLERWNYARYWVAPLIGARYSKDRSIQDNIKGIHFWEEVTGIWEDEGNEIVGVVNCEYPLPGMAFLQRHPKYIFLLDQMLDYAEAALTNKKKNVFGTQIYEHDELYMTLVQQRGYQKDIDPPEYDLEFIVKELPKSNLPNGYSIHSMADENNIELRRKIYGLGFNHPDPTDWPSTFLYEELQRAPDYRKDLDLYIVGPDGDYVACCIAWFDEQNRIGIIEPLATHPDFRQKGFGREVLMEGIRRITKLSAEKVLVGTSTELQFYETVGFQKKYISHIWSKQF